MLASSALRGLIGSQAPPERSSPRMHRSTRGSLGANSATRSCPVMPRAHMARAIRWLASCASRNVHEYEPSAATIASRSGKASAPLSK